MVKRACQTDEELRRASCSAATATATPLVCDYFLTGGSSSFAAILTNSASRLGLHFPHHVAAMDLHRDFAGPKLKAICLLSMPETTKPMTSRSRAVSVW